MITTLQLLIENGVNSPQINQSLSTQSNVLHIHIGKRSPYQFDQSTGNFLLLQWNRFLGKLSTEKKSSLFFLGKKKTRSTPFHVDQKKPQTFVIKIKNNTYMDNQSCEAELFELFQFVAKPFDTIDV